MSSKVTTVVPGTMFIDAIPYQESGRVVRYLMTVHSPQIQNSNRPVRIIATSLSYSDEWKRYTVQDNDCSLSLIICGKQYDNVKLVPSSEVINFRKGSISDIEFQSNGYYIISVHSEDDVTLLPLTTLADVTHSDGKYFFPKDVNVSGARNSIKELSDIVDDIVEEIPYFVKMDDSGNATIPGVFSAENFISGNVNLLEVSSQLSTLITNYNQHIEDYNQLVTLVAAIRTTVSDIVSRLETFVQKNDDGSITVKDVKFTTSGGTISVLDVCNTVSDIVTNLNQLISNFNILNIDYGQTKSKVDDIEAAVTLNSTNISEMDAKIKALSDAMLELSNLGNIDFTKFVQYDSEGDVNTNDIKFDASGLILYDGLKSDGSANNVEYQDNESLYRVINGLMSSVNAARRFIVETDLSELGDIDSIKADISTLSSSVVDLEAHVSNMNIHVNKSEKDLISKLMDPDLVYVATDSAGGMSE